ncbi:autoinducer binding domain-containing protein [Pseudovibrio ascidiaceicola]|uniref:helix-turn-helix transcriptional regulator n=1 Tax=Pseudovibrio ascidiaceicola TaxID=285279 RepID=UPI003D369C76
MLDERFHAIADHGFAIGIGSFVENDFDLQTTYASEWQKEYFNLGGLAKDPVVQFGLRSSGLQTWDNSSPKTDFLRAAHDHNLCHGVAFSNAISGSKLIAGVARSRGFSLLERTAIQTNLREHHLNQLCEKTKQLNPLQKTLVQLSAQGCRSKEIAHYFEVSEEAIKQRKSKIQKLIGVNNFTCVTALAARVGFAFHPIN